MPFDYLAEFPIPAATLPPHLRVLLEPEGLAPDARVSVAVMRNVGPGRSHQLPSRTISWPLAFS
jgi:hypothetical protein